MSDASGARFLYLDIETTDLEILHRSYDLSIRGNYRFHPDQIIRDWSILSFAWAINDEPVKCMSVSHSDVFNDKFLVYKLRELIDGCDIIVGHNSDHFDIKKINSRALYHKFAPLPIKQTADTLKIARKRFKLTSNKLVYLCKYLGVTNKGESPDWIKVMEGDPNELSVMREYNRLDVIATREAFKVLRGWDPAGYDLNVYNMAAPLYCPKCGSLETRKDGFRHYRTGKKQCYRCNSCGSYFQEGAKKQ